VQVAEELCDADGFRAVLRRAIGSPPNDESLEAAIQLAGKARVLDLAPEIAAALEHRAPGVREAASITLEEFRKYLDLKSRFGGAATKDLDAAYEKAVQMTASASAKDRANGALALGALREPRAVPRLLELLSDGDASVQEAAAAALRTLNAQGR
jgi:HEAT repeat protein